MAKTSLTLRPFLFTSDQELQDNSNLWYIMWVNPQKIDFRFTPRQTETFTKKGYGVLHWKNEPPVISFSGISGWLFGGELDVTTRTNISSAADVFNPNRPDVQNLQDPDLTQAFNHFKKGGFGEFVHGMEYLDKMGETLQTSSVNDPRLFVSRLRRVALQDKYYFNYSSGVYEYNNRQLLIYSKRYPEGRQLNGFFESFSIPESAQDPQYVRYDATFRVLGGLEDEESSDNEFRFMSKFYGVKS